MLKILYMVYLNYYEKILEAKKVSESGSDTTIALGRAIDNYRSSQEKLAKQFNALKETSQNPNVDKLLENAVDRAVKHEKIFDELQQKLADNPTIPKNISITRNVLEQSVAEAAKQDTIGEFVQKLGIASNQDSNSITGSAQSRNITNRLLEETKKALSHDTASDTSVRCKADEDKIVQLQNQYKDKTLTEKDFLLQTKAAQKDLLICFYPDPKGQKIHYRTAEEINDEEFRIGRDCNMEIAGERDKAFFDLEAHKITTTEYDKKMAEINRKFKECQKRHRDAHDLRQDMQQETLKPE